MWSKTLYLEFIALYLLSLVPWPNPNVIKLLCSKDNARLVRKLIQLKWNPILDKYHVKLPIDCPLHPFRDIFGPQQDAKKRERPSQWTCRLCGKSFFEEKFIDKHFENRHKEFINKAEDSVCFADFCDLMRCEVFLSQDLNFINDDLYGGTDIEVWSDTTSSSSSSSSSSLLSSSTSSSSSHMTSSSSLAQTNARNLLQIRKKNVLSIAAAIAGTSAQKIPGMHFHKRHFCRDQNDDPSQPSSSSPSSSSSSSSSSSITTSSSQLIEDDEIVSEKNHNEPKPCENRSQQEFTDSDGNKNNDNNMNMQKMRYNCKPEELAKLKDKCELLIRTCITGLLLEMSDYAFKEMEEELNKAVCWYLTCDRYWEDGPLEPKAFPWGLILVLVMVLSLGICFCYYIIWILFDTDETINNSVQTLDRYSHSPTGTRYRQNKRIFQRGTKIIDTSGGSVIGVSVQGSSSNPSSNIVSVGGGGGVGGSGVGIIGYADTTNPDNIIKQDKYSDDILMHHHPHHHHQTPTSSTDGGGAGGDLTQNEHYIYVTYPPDLKRRLIEKYE